MIKHGKLSKIFKKLVTRNINYHYFFILFLSVIVIIATLRYPGLTPDTLSYFLYTDFIRNGNITIVEPFHVLITLSLINLGFSNELTTQCVFMIYIILTLFFLSKAYFGLPNRYLVMCLAILQTYIYLNLVQMRWGLASSILLYSLSLPEKKITKSFVLLAFASTVHYFSLLFTFIVLLKPRLFSLRIWIAIPFVFLFLPKALNSNLLLLFVESLQQIFDLNFLSYIYYKLDFYFERIVDRDNVFTLFNAFNFSSFAILSICIINNKDLGPILRFIPGFAMLLSLYFLFLDIPIFSRRIMIFQLLFAAPVFVYCIRFFKPSLLFLFFGISLSVASFFNIAFIKSLVRIL